jgi:hypothetical protein
VELRIVRVLAGPMHRRAQMTPNSPLKLSSKFQIVSATSALSRCKYRLNTGCYSYR